MKNYKFLSYRFNVKICILIFLMLASGQINIAMSQNVKDISYSTEKLDIYPVSNSKLNVVLIFIHGGGWSSGDKSAWDYNNYNFFRKNGILTVSVNYSLTDVKATNPKRHPYHINDVCNAIKWVYENIEKYGGDKNNIFLIGHSSGSQLVALASTNQKYLTNINIDQGLIKGSILLDAGPYLSMNDLKYCESNMKKDYVVRDLYNAWINAFGKDSLLWQDALPYHNIKSNIPPILLLHSDVDYRVKANDNFQQELLKINQNIQNITIKGPDHMAFLSLIGSSDDTYNLSNSILDFIKSNNPCTNDTIELNIDGYKDGNIQWQFSVNKQIWSDIKDATNLILRYKPIECGYIRARVENCSSVYYSDTTDIH